MATDGGGDMTTGFERQHGFARKDVMLVNWREAPYSRWAFHNLCELVPTAEIPCSMDAAETPVEDGGLLSSTLASDIHGVSTAEDYLRHSHTDAFVVMRRGRIVGEYYAPHSGEGARHVVFSISKSITALVSAVLQGQGLIDPDRPVAFYLPEAKESAYGDCSYRDVLDMRVSLDFEEAYLDKHGPFARYRRAMLWNPAEPGTTVEDMHSFLMSLKKADGPHGGGFFYASPNSDLLGIILERVTGKRYSDLVSELLWQPMGACNPAYVTVDSLGTSR